MIRQPKGEIPITVLFENLSDEIMRLAEVALELDGLMVLSSTSGAEMAADRLAGLQGVDALRQSLEAIAQITRSAAEIIPVAANIALPRGELAHGVTIQKVRDACLAPHQGFGEPLPEMEAAPAEMIFFDDV